MNVHRPSTDHVGDALKHRSGSVGSDITSSKEFGMKGSRKAVLLGLMMAAGAVAIPTVASAGIAIDIDVAPPPVRVEPIPPPQVGMVWAPGFWEWRGNAHVWVPGHYMHERRGYHWIGDHWIQRGPHWHHERGHWER
jgi:hypothetical protein